MSPLDDNSTPIGFLHYWQYMLSAVAGAASIAIGYVLSVGAEIRTTVKGLERLEKRVTDLEADRQKLSVAVAALPTRDEVNTMRTAIHEYLKHISERLDHIVDRKLDED